MLVDVRDWNTEAGLPPAAYVPEEQLTSPELEAGGEDELGSSWVEVHGSDPLQHPYLFALFLGQDARGDYIPCRLVGEPGDIYHLLDY